MTLELNRLTGQVDVMGQKLAERRADAQKRGAEASALLAANPVVTDELLRKIDKARETDEWRRGAKPLGNCLDERHSVTREVPEAILIATDGSQIFPDRHAITTYYLVNTGTIVFRKGSRLAPSTDSAPEIFFADEDVYDDEGQVIGNDEVSLLRGRREIEALARLAEQERAALGGDLSVPIVALVDGPLLPWLRPDPQRSDKINEEIDFVIGQLERLRKVQAIPVGYVDRPGSAFVLRILELMGLAYEAITRESLRAGPVSWASPTGCCSTTWLPTSEPASSRPTRTPTTATPAARAATGWPSPTLTSHTPPAARTWRSPASKCRAGSPPARTGSTLRRRWFTRTASRPVTHTYWPAPTSWRW